MQFREKYNILYKMFHVELFKASLVQRRFPYQGKCRRRRQKGNLGVCKADGGIVIKSSGRASHNLPTSGRRIPFLRCPKYSSALRLEYFDRGAKDCSLHRPQDALRSLCSTWNIYKKHKRPPSGGPLCSFRGMCLWRSFMASFYITVGADAKRTGAVQKL